MIKEYTLNHIRDPLLRQGWSLWDDGLHRHGDHGCGPALAPRPFWQAASLPLSRLCASLGSGSFKGSIAVPLRVKGLNLSYHNRGL